MKLITAVKCNIEIIFPFPFFNCLSVLLYIMIYCFAFLYLSICFFLNSYCTQLNSLFSNSDMSVRVIF